MDSFDFYNDNTHMASRAGWNFHYSYILQNVTGRISGRAISITGGNGYAYRLFGSDYSTIYFGIAIRQHEVGDISLHTSYPLIELMYDTTSQVKIFVNADRGFTVYKGDNTLIGSTTEEGLANWQEWGFLEGKIVIHATTGEVTLKWNEEEVFSDTAADTHNGYDYVDRLKLRCMYNGRDTYFDDFYVEDSQLLGNCHITSFYPDSDSGTHTDFERSTGSADYECVDDGQVPNDDTDYIKSSTVGHKSTFGITTGELATVKAIQVSNLEKIADAGVRKTKALLRSNSVDYTSAESAALANTWKYLDQIWETDPDDSNPWTQTKLEAAEFGLEITT
jgi:hypothetical protein